jgi:hypothetical protein
MTASVPPAPPPLEYALTIALNLGRAHWVRPSQYGSERAGVFVTDGTVAGPGIRGSIIRGSGGDYPWLRGDGVIDFDARYMLQTDDGAVIYLQNRGYRWGPKDIMEKIARGEPVPDDSYYMRVAPKFEAPAGNYDWLNRYVFVGRAEKTPAGNRIHYFKVL